MAARTLPFVGDLLAFGSDRLGYLTRVSGEQGDVARITLGPYQCWLLSHPDHVQDVLIQHADHFRKGPVLQRAQFVLGDGLLTAEGDVHRRHRDIVQPAFHSRRITGYAETMISRALAMSDSWTAGVPLDVHAETVRLTLASAASTLLGADVGDDDIRTVEDAVADLLAAYKLAFVPFGWRLQRIPVGPMRRLRRGRQQLYRVVDPVIAARKAAAGAGDLLSALVRPEDSDRLSDQEIRDHAVTLLLAGHETTANALTFAFHLLALHPDIEGRVHAEVDETLESGMPGPQDHGRLPFCRAVISEALRLYPPSWAIARQALDDHRVGDHLIRAGDLVLLSPWLVHRDPRWWPEPESFRPDRWLDGESKERPRWAYFPFGAGIRRCIGEGFAWTEGVLVLAAVARRWRLRAVPHRPLRLEPLITLRPRDGLWLRPEPRTRRKPHASTTS
ncbi:cytochrome P450 [Phytoactinopolyspora alkaliphila]|uniref:Cytochrome P450 n=1 Tax=Phytoactinopolyspora alkaliphila TaxID=1783498 RepID=A0A6N9YGA7_9ACTN|nr:cytochrome P450 [Phytoactinopolyspora alkaliphila]NED94033.1 cytochrome P450 [Phytoactinopolyspora alkaliphila]